MLYLSKPRGTHGVFYSRRSQGALDIVRLVPGTSYTSGYPDCNFVGERDSLAQASEWADTCDEAYNPFTG